MRLHADDQRRTVGEIVVVHQVQRRGVLIALVGVEPEIGILVEVVEVGYERQVRTHLVLFVGVVDRRTDGHTYFNIAVGVAVADMRSVERHRFSLGLPVPVLRHILAHGGGVFEIEHAAQAVFLHELPAPAHLRAVVRRVEPLVGHVDLVGFRQVAEMVVVVVHLSCVGVRRAVEQDDARQLLVFGHGKCRRDVGLGTQLVIEIEVHEEPFVVRGLAVFEVDLPRDGLVARRDRGHAFRHLNRIEPHAGRIAQAVGSAQAAHDRTVFVEDLGVSPGQPQHLDLPGARNGVAVTDGHRRRVLERFGQIAAGHLAETRERDHLALDDAVALDEIAAEVPFDHDIFESHALRTEGEFDLIDAAFDADRIVDVAQVGGHEFVVAFHPVQLESALRVGAGTDRRSGPVDRSSDQRLFVRIADHAPQILGVQRTANGEGRKRKE